MYYNEQTKELTNIAPWGNGYISDTIKTVRFKDWKIVNDDFVPKNELLTKDKLDILDKEYNLNKDALSKYYLEALLNTDTNLQKELQQNMIDLNSQYDADRNKLESSDK